ncbi:MAG: Mur ligase family protein [Deltaproteobacteria bacterium]
MNYAETVEYLCGLEASRGWDLKLERVRAALVALGSPETGYPAVLIAGTNGKGTTAALTAAAFQQAGLRVGLYTSPHLVHFTERIRIDGDELGRAAVVALVAEIRRVAPPEETGLTFFEVTTLIALLAFAASDVDIAILEVGLGGRLDATNVVEPLASAVVSIDYDHEAWLGSTLAEIAGEKAGVMRADRLVVVGAAIAPEAAEVLENTADGLGARLVRAESGFFPLALAGAHMQNNARVAAALVRHISEQRPEFQVTSEQLALAFAATRFPGRMSRFDMGVPVIADGAHNRAAADALCGSLAELLPGQGYRLVFGALSDKDWQGVGRRLAGAATAAAVVPIANPRAVPVAELRHSLAACVPTRAAAGVAAAVAEFAAESSTIPVVVAGSLFLVGELYEEVLRRQGCTSVFALSAGEGA